MKLIKLLPAFVCILSILVLPAQKKISESNKESLENVSLDGLAFRSIGPSITGGRVVAIAVNPENHSEYYVGSGHGSLWKTTNNGITFNSIFDNENSYAIGAVAIDPTNPNTVWVGTGVHNNQRYAIHGDGIYKSEDGGKNWKNMGLKNSFHIGGIAIDPNNSNIVFAAAYGAIRKGNEERGIYKTTDGGETWKKVLYINEYTGCYQVHMDPSNANILYAVAHQRAAKLFTTVYGGKESGIYRSTDGGESWSKMTAGLPKGDIGRIGMAISPVNSDILYAIVEAKEEGGFYKSEDRGVSWTKKNSYVSTFPFYFQKIFCDTKNVNRVYSMDVQMKVSIDGGTTWSDAGEDKKHVDNHALWIDPNNNKHMINGCDGGVYETYDQAKNWDYKSNIPIAEIYKITTDNDTPFYNVYIGTQDNFSLGGPSRTINSSGITNRDWFFTKKGDGFQTQVDWIDPNIIYTQSQFGSLARYNKKTGESLYIQPSSFDDSTYRFDWDSPLLISTFNNKRLYFAANKLFRTDDRGNTWEVISPDLTRGVPDEMLNLMDRSWSIDEMASKGNNGKITSIAESPLDENLIFTGSGDGLIHYSNNGGTTWNKSLTPDLPEYARVNQIIASQFDKNVVYAACDNFSAGNFKPYLLKSTNQGKSWFLHNGNLPENGCTYTMAQDDQDKNLLFVGTLYGVFFTNNEGRTWIQLKNGIPTSSVRSLVIQKREKDLVVSTFGRGVYILDDYTALRDLSQKTINKEAHIFPIKTAKMFIEASPIGGYSGVGWQGARFYSAPNPEIGAVFTYYIKKKLKSLHEQRRDQEKEKQDKNEDIKYPTYQQLLDEKLESDAYLLFTVSDENDKVIRKIKTSAKEGIHRITWDFRYEPVIPISISDTGPKAYWSQPDIGYMVLPGTYKVALSKFQNGAFTELVPPQEFNCESLFEGNLSNDEEEELKKFNKKVASLAIALSGADELRKSLKTKTEYFEKAFVAGANVPNDIYQTIQMLKKDLDAIDRNLNGDSLKSQYEGAMPTSLKARIDGISYWLWRSSSLPTTTYKQSYELVSKELGSLLEDLITIDNQVKTIESKLNDYGAPYTPGRIPEWKEKDH